MSRGFVKEGDQEEVPMVLPRAFLPKNVPNYVTPEGLHLLNEEMENLKSERAETASNYILKNHIDAKMRQLAERINTAVLIDPSKANQDVVSFGMYVRYNDKTIRIVGVDEADASKGLISFLSPIAKSLIGKRKGDVFEIKVPKGTEKIEIQEVALFLEIQELRNSGNERLQDNKTTRPQVVVERNEELTISTTVAVTEPVEVASDVHELTRKEHEKIGSSDVHELTRKEHENVGISCRDITSVASEKESSTAKSQQPKLPSTSSGSNPVTEPVEVTKSSEFEVQRSEFKVHRSEFEVQSSEFKVHNNPTDFLPIINERGNIVGRALHCEIHNGNKVLHPAVHLIVCNSKNEIVGKYCWHVEFGETAEKTLKRKIVDVTSQSIKPKFKKQYLREDKNEKEFVSVFTVVSDADFLPSPDDKEYEAMFAND